MRINIRTIFILLLPLFVSCSQDDQQVSGNSSMTVSIGSSPEIGIQSRTILGEDGISVSWAKDDKIAVWAENSTSEFQFSAAPFALWHYNQEYNAAKFTATIGVMPDDTYSYYAVSPLPASTDGTQASYTIPATQTGVFNGAYDVMVAKPVISAGALQQGDNSKAVNFSFSHKIHILKIRIPENRMNEPVSELELVFPIPVTGTLTVDATAPDAAPVLTAGSNVLSLQFATPIDAGSIVYATIAPVDIPDTDNITIQAFAETGMSEIATMPGKHFIAGHTTPIALSIPKMGKLYTRLGFSLNGTGEETLGEAITDFTITGPSGTDLGNGTNTRTFTVNASNLYTCNMGRYFTDNLSGQTFTVVYKSESAIVSNTFTMPQLTPDELNNVPACNIPYLLFEDFSGIGDFSGSAATGNAGGEELSGAGLPGWYAGARSQGYANTCVNLQHYNNIGGPYHSRLNSCQLSAIKTGKTISVKVVFNGDWKKNKSGWMNLIVGRSTGTNLNDAINSNTSISMSNNSSASSTNIPTLRTVTIPDFTSEQSISWKTDGANKGLFNYEDLFIDNIKVSIAK